MADRQKFTNNAVLTLGLDLSSTATTLTLASGDGVRTPSLFADEFFLLTLINSSGDFEIVRVTGRTADVCTIVRGREGTVARAFAAGDAAELRWTRESIERFPQKNADEMVTGARTFTVPPVIPDATATNHPVAKGQADAAYMAASREFTSGALTDVHDNNAQEGAVLVRRGSSLVYEFFSDQLQEFSWGTPGSYTFTVPSGARRALVEVVAGGGGGSQGLGRGFVRSQVTSAQRGGDGGSGGYARAVVDLTGLTTVTVVVGAAGTAGSPSATATAGGNSSFGNIVIATGGQFGTAGSTNIGSLAGAAHGVDGAAGEGTKSSLPSMVGSPYAKRGAGGRGTYAGSTPGGVVDLDASPGEPGMVNMVILE